VAFEQPRLVVGARELADAGWATDLTKIATREGWLGMVGVIDCHDRNLIGHRYRTSADTRRAHRRRLGTLPRRPGLKAAGVQHLTTGVRSSPAAATPASFTRSASTRAR